MEKYSDYVIVQAEDAGELSRQVKQLLEEGWLLLGAPFSHTAADGAVICQAMLRQEGARAGSIGFNRQ